ncbi:MAG: hypothetical protein J1E99_02560 [Muribaculaceae bacterium]|nr:hypothetical protein [Muribaculaceae bacterium]
MTLNVILRLNNLKNINFAEVNKFFRYRKMGQMIELGRELLRINSAKNTVEYSKDGRNWIQRGPTFNRGILRDLCLFGQYVYAASSKGVYFSKDKGLNWWPKTVTPIYGEFQSLMVSGTQLYAVTSKGTYYSKDGGVNWIRT